VDFQDQSQGIGPEALNKCSNFGQNFLGTHQKSGSLGFLPISKIREIKLVDLAPMFHAIPTLGCDGEKAIR
jgi:hypothetical protein